MTELRNLIGDDRVSTQLIDRLAFAHDASLYRLVPQAVVRPASVEHIQQLLAWCIRTSSHLTFRAAGTSLSGQAVTDGILVDLSRDWTSVTVLDDGRRVRMQPGITGARVNAHLRTHGRKLGPDPASIIAAMIGGIIANNASGMCCGTAQNSYNTLSSMTYVLANGVTIDTAHSDADRHLQERAPSIHQGIATLRDDVRADEGLVATIRRKYAIKNTIGYSLNAFLDEDEPARIIARLMIGSEGTLGFISDVTLNTIADATTKWTAMIVYDSVDEACATVPFWRDAGAAAVEIMDDASLRSFAQLTTTPDHLRITTPGASALLVEFHDVEPPSTASSVSWTTDPREQAILWRLRKGLMPSIGAMRSQGATMINEDIAVPPHHLASLVKDVRASFAEFGYDEGIIFGHAKDGNIHFIVNQSFESSAEVDRYERFMDRIAEIVVDRYAGSLKAEHGTGRNMSPYVEREWGSAAYAVMYRVKELLDPHAILNPDVVLCRDVHAHVKNIKSVPSIGRESTANLCIECGFCEHVCPSRGLTLTPRQRIVLQRERVINAKNRAMVAEIDRSFAYSGIETCAADSMCSVVCPVGIDTGALIKDMRADSTSRGSRILASVMSKNMRLVNSVARVGSSVIRRYGRPHRAASNTLDRPDAIYVQTCPSKTLGAGRDGMSLDEVVLSLAQRAGLRLTVIDSDAYCCGQPYASKGFHDAAHETSSALINHLLSLTSGSAIPVIIDTSTCAAALVGEATQHGLHIIDQVGFAELVMKGLTITSRVNRVVVHPGCGVEKLRSTETFMNVVRSCAQEVVVPPSAGCCGMGGDRGVMYPELVESALRSEKNEIPTGVDLGVSCNVLCEGALTRQTGIPYMSLLHLVEQATRH
ncbi:MAG: FAD-binding oxidoreductase [Ignavibacteria bacterium]|nr:FAD-binding oxidoreductase [Ignavibacteria bacterium]